MLRFLCFDKIKEGLASFYPTVSPIYFLDWSLSHILRLYCIGYRFSAFFQSGRHAKNTGGITYVHIWLVVSSVVVDVKY